MSRIRSAYGAKFRALLLRAGARKLEQGICWYFEHAEALVGHDLPMFRQTGRATLSEALEFCYQQTRARIARSPRRLLPSTRPVCFVCDVGLGGLARWLRVAGYMAWWREGVDDVELIEEARRKSAILLTTDSGIMERRILRDGHLPGLWLSPGLTKFQQLQSVLSDLELPLLTPRCMDCGGELEPASKTALADRIPPKTFRWRDEYFLCRSCGKLFWYGTHWRNINHRLSRAQDPKTDSVPQLAPG